MFICDELFSAPGELNIHPKPLRRCRATEQQQYVYLAIYNSRR
jgi:hypothetical protein